MKEAPYRERRWRPVRWWEIASLQDPSRMPFLHHYPEPPAVLVAQILTQARVTGVIAAGPPLPAPPVNAEDPWGEDGDLVRAWFAQGDRPMNQTAPRAGQGGTYA